MNIEPALPVIDLDVLLQPISEENPSGEAMQYSGLYDEIREARKSEDASLAQGDWRTELKVADYRQVTNLATAALTSQTKDLQVCAWLTEAITKQHGFPGLRDGMKLICGVEENFWETCFPEIDEGDMEGRANAIEWVDKELSLAVKTVPLTLGQGFTFNHWEESRSYDIPENLDSLSYDEQDKFTKLKAQADAENRKTGDMWRVAKAATNRAFAEQLYLTISECVAELNNLDRTNEEKFDRNQVPAVRELKKSLADILSVADGILKEKREQEPDEEDFSAEETGGEISEEISEEGETIIVRKGAAVASGAIQSRQDALKRLSDVADYFKKAEPHSPVAYLVERAVKWGNMPLEAWLQEVIKDSNTIENLREILGMDNSNSSEY
jgi:type VI secretion system protein ImpA